MEKDKQDEPNLDPVYYLALDGNLKAAVEKLISLDPNILTAKEKESRGKFIQKFGGKDLPRHPKGESLVSEITSIFESYWDQVLLQKLNQDEGHTFLFEQLKPVIERLGGTIGPYNDEEFERVAEFLGSKLKETGVFSIMGNVKPHLNFMAWKAQTTKPYRVNLGEGETQLVEVVLMDNFLVLGWAAYATFDKLYVGGWVDKGSELYCVAPSWDLESEKFKVSFLAHEARHFLDKKKYPKLKSLDLEYRAKLNELMLAEHSLKDLLNKFALEQKENPGNPHSYASFLMLQRFAEKLGFSLSIATIHLASAKQIHKYAGELMREHTAALDNHSPQQVESVLPKEENRSHVIQKAARLHALGT